MIQLCSVLRGLSVQALHPSLPHCSACAQVVHYDLPKDTEAFLHRSGRTGRAGKSGSTIAVLMPRDRGVFRRICQETKISNLEWITTPAPGDVMAASAKQVSYLVEPMSYLLSPS